MSVRNLEDVIKKRLERCIKGAQLTDSKGEVVEVEVLTGYPSELENREKPFILIRPTKIKDTPMDIKVDISLYYGTIALGSKNIDKSEREYADNIGYWDIVSLIDKIRRDFLGDNNFDFGILEQEMDHNLVVNVQGRRYLGESKLRFMMPAIGIVDSEL